MKNFGLTAEEKIARYQASMGVGIALPALPKAVVIAPAPTVVVPPAPPQVTPEKIPLSDPRHPQHAEWLAMQAESESSPLGWYIGGAVLLAGVGYYFYSRKSSQGVAP